MPERNIIGLKREYINPKENKNNKFYFLNISKNVVRDYNIMGDLIDEEFLESNINGVYSKYGDIILKLNEKHDFKTYIIKNRYAKFRYMIIIPDELVSNHSLLENNFIDIIFNKIKKKGSEEIIYKNSMQWGLKEINPKNIIEIYNKKNNSINSIYEV